jgi:hypothetical protein
LSSLRGERVGLGRASGGRQSRRPRRPRRRSNTLDH